MAEAIQVVAFVILGVAGLVYLVSRVRRDSHAETRELAATRGQRVDDLEEEVARLRDEVEELRGELAAYEKIKTSEIAVEVARLLEPRLPRLD